MTTAGFRARGTVIDGEGLVVSTPPLRNRLTSRARVVGLMEDSLRVRRYHRTRRILGVAVFVLDVAVLVAWLATGWSRDLRDMAQRWSAEPAVALLIFLVIFGLVAKTVGWPLDFARGYWLEHRYALSNLTLRGWLKDQFKGLLVAGVLGACILEGMYWTMRRWPQHWWVIAATLFVGLFVLLANLAPVLILPLFFKFRPLENPSLAQKLLELSRRAGTRVRGVFEWKLSEKTKKANAVLAGWGNTRRILVADTLLQHFAEDEVEAVLAHEFGHHVHRHTLRGMLVQTGATFLGLWLVNVVLVRFSDRFGFAGVSDFANLPLLILVITGLSLALLPLVNAHSRAMERQADAYALAVVPSKSAFVSSMEKLAELNLAEQRPNRWIEFIFHSHPSVEKRIALAQRFRG